jgi:hypothetical protein
VAKNHGEQFYADGAPRAEGNFVNAEVSAGARGDGTLYPCHFNGADLNSLGQTKLDLMLKEPEASKTLTVYFSFDDNSMTDARKKAVTDYLKAQGLSDDEIALKDGPNPDSKCSAAENIAALQQITGSASDAKAPQ